MRCFLIVLWNFVLAVSVGFAQSGAETSSEVVYGEISGRVFDALSLQPLPDVNIAVLHTPFGTASAADGSFLIRNLPPDDYAIEVTRIGYQPVKITVRVKPGRLTVKNVRLVAATIEMGEVIMTASRKEQTAGMAPASVDVVDSREIEARNVSTFNEVIENVPGITVNRTIGASVQSLSIRGSSDVAGGGVGNRVLLAIDGRPALRSDSGGALWSLVPTNFIDRVEIVKGAFSSLYGSTAMGGVINVITKKPAHGSYVKVDADVGVFELPPKSIRYKDSPNTYNTLTVSHSRRLGEKLAYLVSVSRKDSDGHRQRSGYEFYNLYGKMYLDLSDNRNLEITLGGDIGKNDYPHPWMGNLHPLEVAPRRKDNTQRKHTFSTDVFYYAIPNPKIKYSSRFYYYRTFVKSEFNPDDPQRLIPGNEPFGLFTRSISQKLGNITQLDYSFNDRNYLVLGLDVQRDLVDSIPDTIMFGKHQVNNFALYAQDEHDVLDNLVLTLGLRYDVNKLEGGRSLTQVSPKVALVYSPVKWWNIRALAGRAFRAPSIAERFFQKEIAGGTRFKPNPQLNAEKVFSYELGSKVQLWNWADIDLSYFHYKYTDMIFWINISQEEQVNFTLFQVRNLNAALIQGLEFGLRFHPVPQWRTSFGYTYLDAKDQSDNRKDDTLPYKVKHTFSFTSLYQFHSWLLELDGRYRSKVEEVFLYPNDEPDAFFVLNGKIQKRFTRHLNLSVGINNIFDKQYEELARYRMPGRTWVLGSSVEF